MGKRFMKSDGKHRHVAVGISLILMATLLLAVSCATTGDSRSLKGVWDSKDGDFSCRISFTADGYYAYEEFFEGSPTYLEFGRYEAVPPGNGQAEGEDGTFCITLGYSTMEYSWEGADLVIDLWGDPTVFSRTSKNAKNNSSGAELAGVWSFRGGLLGFTKGGFAISMVRGGDSGNYRIAAADEERDLPAIVLDGEEMPFLIIGNRLFLDDSGFAGEWERIALDRLKKGGEDQTSRDILVNANPWHLTDTDYGTSHYIYTFRTDGTYSMLYYTDYDDSRSTSYGSFTYGNHRISLSDDADLSYAIIDLTPFMFTD